MSDDYCELCDLPKSTCIHGRPPVEPPKVVRARTTASRTPKPRVSKPKAPATASVVAPTKVVPRRWTPPEVFKPLILSVLREAGGVMDAEDAFLELEILIEDKMLAGDNELTPEGELRWRYAARRARIALVDEGLMIKGTPGVWQLA